MNATKHRLHPAAWGVLTVLFGAALIYALPVWLCDESGSPSIRFAVAVCGFLFVYAERQGGWLRRIGRFVYARRFPPRVILPYAVIFLFAWVAFGLLLTFQWTPSRAVMRRHSVGANLKQAGLALIEYEQDYDDLLPPSLDPGKIGGYLASYHRLGLLLVDPVSRKPFAWRTALAGVDTKQIANKGRIVVAYSSVHTDGETLWRAVVFLDGHVRSYSEAGFVALLRAQPARFPLPRTKGKK